jgi:signal transduction histidine kinase
VWFAACEAVSNALKHAQATTIDIHLQDLGDRLHLVVADDGCGGADPSGSGLRGLADRVEAAGGLVTVRSPRGEGTSVEAVLPCAS